LTEAGAGYESTSTLTGKACGPALIHIEANCTWDKMTRVMTTPRDATHLKKSKELKSMSFFKDVINEKNAADKASKPGEKTNCADSDCLFQLDHDHTVKTVHEKNEEHYTTKKYQLLLRLIPLVVKRPHSQQRQRQFPSFCQ